MNTEVSICLPIYNEAKSIKFVLQEWTKILERLKVRYNIICSEDGSNDGTKQILNSLSKKNKKIINNSSIFKRGYGKAVISGIEKSKSKYIVCIDSDGQCDPRDLNALIKKMKPGKCVVVGFRNPRNDGFNRIAYSKLFGLFYRLLGGPHRIDPSSPFVLARTNEIKSLGAVNCHLGFGFWWEFQWRISSSSICRSTVYKPA